MALMALPRGKLRALWRAVVWVAALGSLLAVVALLALFLTLHTDRGRGRLRQALLDTVQGALAGRIHVGDFEGDLLQTLVLHDVAIEDPEGQVVLRAGRITLHGGLGPLLVHIIYLSEVSAEDVAVRARYLRDGRLNLLALGKTQTGPGAAAGAPYGLIVASIRARATLRYEPLGDGPALDGRLGLLGSARLTSGHAEIDLGKLSLGLERPDGAAITASGGLHVADGRVIAREVALSLAVDGAELRRWLPALRPRGGCQAKMLLSGPTSALRFSLALQPPRGEIQAEGLLDLTAPDGPVWQVNASARGLDPGALWKGAPGGEIAFAATGRGKGPGGTIELSRGAVLVPGARGTVRGRIDLGGEADLTLQAEAERLGRLGWLARLAGLPPLVLSGGASTHAHLVLGAGRTRITAEVRGTNVRVGTLRVGHPEGRLQAAGSAGEAQLDAGRVTVAGMGFTGVTLSARAERGRLALHLLGQGPRGTTIRIESHGVPVRRGGTLAGLDMTLDRLSVAAAGQQWRSQRPARLRVGREVLLSGLELVSGPERLGLEAHYAGGRVWGELSLLSLGARLLSRFDLSTSQGGDPALRTEVEVHGLPLRRLRGLLPPPLLPVVPIFDGSDVRASLVYEHGSAHLGVQAEAGGAPLLVVHGEAAADWRRVRSGWREVPVLLSARVPGFELSRVSRLGGTLAGSLTFRGTLLRPDARGELRVDGLRLASWQPGTLQATAAFDGRQVTGRLEVVQPTAHLPAMRVDATLPMERARPFTLDLLARHLRIDLGGLGPDDLAGLRSLHALFDADLHLGGTLARPLLRGSAHLAEGAIALGDDPVWLREVRLDADAGDGQVQIRRLLLSLNGGALSGSGTVQLDGPWPARLDGTLGVSGLPFARGNLAARIDALLGVHAESQGGLLMGRVTVQKGGASVRPIAPGKDLQPIGLPADVVLLDGNGGRPRRTAPAPLWAVIALHSPGTFQLRGTDLHRECKQLQADLKGDLRIEVRGSRPRVSGAVESVGGMVQLHGRRFTIESARLDFDGGADIDPKLALRATHDTREGPLTIALLGTARHPLPILPSGAAAAYDESRLLGAVLSGDPSGRALDMGAISSAVFTSIKDLIAPGLPVMLSVDNHDTGRSSQAQLGVSMNLSDDITLGYSHQFGVLQGLRKMNENQGHLMYRLPRGFSLELLGGDTLGSADLYWNLRF